MSKSVNIKFIKQKPDDEFGTLHIRTIENNVIKKKSLAIKITVREYKKFFDEKTQRFKVHKDFPISENYNTLIVKKLNELIHFNNEISDLPNEKKSFIKYWELYCKDISNLGTKMKHETVLKKLKNYLVSIEKSDLLFSEISSEFIRKYRLYLRNNKDKKSLSENTTIHYLKILKSIINQSTNDDNYNYIKNPFNGVKFKVEKNSKSVLSEEDIDKLLNTPIEVERLSRTKEMFLFQVFSNGMRVSDLFLLRWNNFTNLRLEYKMYKTGTEISIPVNINIGVVLSSLLKNPVKYEDVIKNETITFIDRFDDNKYYNIGLKKLIKLIDYLMFPKITYNSVVSKRVVERNNKIYENMGDMITYKGYKINTIESSINNPNQIKMFIDLKENLINQIETRFISELWMRIENEKTISNNNFVFPVLSNDFFKNIDKKNNWSKLNEEQYKSIKHHTIVYNRKLKKVQEICKIETNITSHVSRHTFTNLLLRLDNVNLYDISQSLGHSSIKITENYIKSGFNIEKMDYLNDTLSKQHRKKYS